MKMDQIVKQYPSMLYINDACVFTVGVIKSMTKTKCLYGMQINASIILNFFHQLGDLNYDTTITTDETVHNWTGFMEVTANEPKIKYSFIILLRIVHTFGPLTNNCFSS